jgi:hypothetical protein
VRFSRTDEEEEEEEEADAEAWELPVPSVPCFSCSFFSTTITALETSGMYLTKTGKRLPVASRVSARSLPNVFFYVIVPYPTRIANAYVKFL